MNNRAEKKIKRFSRRQVFKGYCFDVVLDNVQWPNGKRLKRDLVLHGGISVIVPLLDRDHVILIRQYRYGADRMLWEIPAGTMRKGESPIACAKREIEEEIGFTASRWKKFGACYASPGYNTEVINCFLASGLKKTKKNLEADEVLEEKIFSVEKVEKMIDAGKIIDAKSLVALFYFLRGRK